MTGNMTDRQADTQRDRERKEERRNRRRKRERKGARVRGGGNTSCRTPASQISGMYRVHEKAIKRERITTAGHSRTWTVCRPRRADGIMAAKT